MRWLGNVLAVVAGFGGYLLAQLAFGIFTVVVTEAAPDRERAESFTDAMWLIGFLLSIAAGINLGRFVARRLRREVNTQQTVTDQGGSENVREQAPG